MMEKAVERFRRAMTEPNVQGYEGEDFDALLRAMTACKDAKDRKVTFRQGLAEDGARQLWWRVSGEGQSVEGDNSFNCPPLPPQYCEE